LIGLAITFAIGLIVPVITLFGTDVMRVSPRVFALVLVPPALTAALALYPAGRWADRGGRELPLLLGLVIIAIPFWGASLSIDPVIVSLGGMMAGLGYALLVPAWNALIMDWIPARARGIFLGAIATVQGVGLALGPAAGGALWNQIGVYAPFTASALLFSLGVGCAVLIFLRRQRVRVQEGVG
jgi:MFS family permease